MAAIDSIQIGERIKKQRLLNGYSREQLAELVEITPRFCYDLELGLKNMSVSTLCKLADALHVNADYLLFGPASTTNDYDSLISLITTCPTKQIIHLEQIVSHFLQAVQNNVDTDIDM